MGTALSFEAPRRTRFVSEEDPPLGRGISSRIGSIALDRVHEPRMHPGETVAIVGVRALVSRAPFREAAALCELLDARPDQAMRTVLSFEAEA